MQQNETEVTNSTFLIIHSCACTILHSTVIVNFFRQQWNSKKIQKDLQFFTWTYDSFDQNYDNHLISLQNV